VLMLSVFGMWPHVLQRRENCHGLCRYRVYVFEMYGAGTLAQFARDFYVGGDAGQNFYLRWAFTIDNGMHFFTGEL